jgi:membrane-associated phospholipid phosphatase
MKEKWKIFFCSSKPRIIFIISVAILSLLLYTLPHFLIFVENRPGAALPDPVLALFRPVDLTWLIFIIIYASLITALVYLIQNPVQLLKGIQFYAVMVLVRMLSMYIMPLEPPATMIALKDPFVEFFSSGSTLTKDLFFSGHTATMLIFYFITKNKLLKFFFLFCTVVIAVSVILQHVHYTIDVWAAVFFSFAIYKFLEYVWNCSFMKFEKQEN